MNDQKKFGKIAAAGLRRLEAAMSDNTTKAGEMDMEPLEAVAEKGRRFRKAVEEMNAKERSQEQPDNLLNADEESDEVPS